MRRTVLIGFSALAATAALAASAAELSATSGRGIFRFGGEASDVIATFAGSSALLRPGVRRCAACHGADGAGVREGGVTIPPITWRVLTAPREASAGRAGRPGYDETTLRRALADGIDSAGVPLAAGMPRFQLTPAQATALFDHLRIVGSERDLDPGVADDEIRVGTVLPLSGTHAAWGQAMRAGIEAALESAGAIYGRRLRLVAVDAGDNAAAALARLAASDQVFALVASVLAGEADTIAMTDDLPIIGPVAPTPARPAVTQFYLLAPLEDQMRVLVDELASETPHGLRLAVIGPDGSVADAVADQATRNGAIIVRRVLADDGAAALAQAIEPAPDAVLALPGVDLRRLVAELDSRPGDWLLAGPAEALAPGAASNERLRLVLPLLPGDPHSRDASTTPTMPPAAVAATAVLVEGLKRMGARATRAGLVAAIETVRDFPTGVLPPVSFARGQHGCNRASVVIRPDRSRGIVVLGDWRAPR